jgi:hypothetical protein
VPTPTSNYVIVELAAPVDVKDAENFARYVVENCEDVEVAKMAFFDGFGRYVVTGEVKAVRE